MQIGYARVSTAEQDLALQLDALAAAGCERVFTDKASGVKTGREGLVTALQYAREGDTIVIWKLDRLGRSMKGLIDLAAELQERGIELKSITEGIDTQTPQGRFFFNMMAALAVMERDLILERTRAGLSAAKRAGRVGGRPRSMTEKKRLAAIALLQVQTPPKDVAASLGVSIATLYRHLPGAMSNHSK